MTKLLPTPEVAPTIATTRWPICSSVNWNCVQMPHSASMASSCGRLSASTGRVAAGSHSSARSGVTGTCSAPASSTGSGNSGGAVASSRE
ncbi:hypothetical protein D3C72_1391000 [compost metagenome]